jgi:hypothetical protein
MVGEEMEVAMNLKLTAIPALAMLLGAGGLITANASTASAGSPSPAIGQDRDRGNWDAPPGAYNDIQRRGFHDGIEGARRDVENHRRPDVNNRDEYRSPNVPRGMRRVYRDAFRRGYQQAMSHMREHHDRR